MKAFPLCILSLLFYSVYSQNPEAEKYRFWSYQALYNGKTDSSVFWYSKVLDLNGFDYDAHLALVSYILIRKIINNHFIISGLFTRPILLMQKHYSDLPVFISGTGTGADPDINTIWHFSRRKDFCRFIWKGPELLFIRTSLIQQ